MTPPEVAVTLPQLAQQAHEAGSLALDTEFVSEGRYWPQLCLVQFAVQTPNGISVAVVDTLETHDPAPIVAELGDPNIEVVIHAGQQDLAMLRREWNVQPSNVFDTQVGAAFLGSNSQRSYQESVRSFLGRTPDRSEGLTHWDRRPLTPEQLAYAREDVEHLPELANALRERLREAGRLQWARDESSHLLLEGADPRDPERVFRRLTQSGRVSDREATTVRELVDWRDETARGDNRPVKSVLPDHSLMQLARRHPTSTSELKQVRGVGEGVSRRYGEQLVGVLRRAEQKPPVELASRERLPEQAEAMIALGQALVRARAQEEQIASQLITTRAEIEELVAAILRDADEPSTGVLTGWRRELVGTELVELLRGKRSLSVGENGRLVVSPSS